MNDVLNMKISDLANCSFACNCGRTHSSNIEKIIIKQGALLEVPSVLKQYKKGKILIVADTNTYDVAGRQVESLLKDDGYIIHTFIYKEKDIDPDVYFAGRLMMELQKDMSVICAIGSGVINDLVRFIAYRVNLPYIIVGTAPSMDGYASKISPMVVDQFKSNYAGNYPYAIIADTQIVKEAPMIMIQAGLGDMLGKLTAIADWCLSVKVTGEFFCDTMANLMLNALQKCIDNVDKVAKRDESAIGYITEGLVLAGIAMGMYEETRPASGSEHFFAHYWDVDAIKRGEKHPLHGNSVAVGTVISAMLYELAKEYLPANFIIPDSKIIIDILDKVNACTDPKKLGISEELLYQSILHAMDGRDRYTILQFCDEIGKLESYAKLITNKFYG